MIYWDGMRLIGFAVFVACWILIGLIYLVRWLIERTKERWCRHDWDLERTNSYGPKHWYKCTKCGIEKCR